MAIAPLSPSVNEQDAGGDPGDPGQVLHQIIEPKIGLVSCKSFTYTDRLVILKIVLLLLNTSVIENTSESSPT